MEEVRKLVTGHGESEKSESQSVMSNSLGPHGLYNSPGQNAGLGSLSPFQGIFPTQGSNPGLPSCRQILYQLSHKGSPRILEWIAYFLLQWIFPTQGSNLGLLHCRLLLLLLLSHFSHVRLCVTPQMALCFCSFLAVFLFQSQETYSFLTYLSAFELHILLFLLSLLANILCISCIRGKTLICF